MANKARSIWRNRDERMLRDEWAYQLRFTPPKPGQIQQRLNDCAAQIDAADDLMSSVELQINVTTDDNADAQVAQDAEDLARDIWETWKRRYARQGRPPLLQDVCHSLNLYGWLVPRLLLNAWDPAFPFGFELLDPRRVYLDRMEGTPDLIVYFTSLTPSQIVRQWGLRTLHRVLPDAEEDNTETPVDMVHYHTDTELAVSVSGEWLKKPTKHEYPGGNPVQIIMAGGSTFRGTPPLATDLMLSNPWPVEDADAYVGTGFIQAIRPIVEDSQQIADLSADLVAQSARPVTIDKLTHTQLDHSISGVGGWATLKPEESHEQHPPPPQALQYTQALRQERAFQVYQEGLNPQIMGSGEAAAGYDRFLLQATGARRLRPRMEALQLGLTLALERMLQYYATWGGPPVRFVTTDRATGGRRLVERLRPEHLRKTKLRVEVLFGELGVPDLQGRMTVGAMGVREGLISQRYALGTILRVQNPAQVIAESRSDQVWKIPQFTQMAALVETAKTGEPVYAAMAMELLPASVARLVELAKPPQPPGPAPGQGPPGPGQQGPPLPGSELPSTPAPGIPPQMQPPPMAGPPGTPNGAAPPGAMPPGAALPR